MRKGSPGAAKWRVLYLTGLLFHSGMVTAEPHPPAASLFPEPGPSQDSVAVPPPGPSPSGCGLLDEPLPDFELVDLNPNSASYGATYTLGTFQSQVLVIYWALAS